MAAARVPNTKYLKVLAIAALRNRLDTGGIRSISLVISQMNITFLPQTYSTLRGTVKKFSIPNILVGHNGTEEMLPALK